jgi:hypothetical protein
MSKEEYVVLFLVIGFIGLIANIYALFYFIQDVNAPILHDVYEHARMAKSIVQEDRISFFYSPLLHSLTAMLSFGDIWNIPKLTLFTTHLGVIFNTILLTALSYRLTKSFRFTVLTFLLISSFHFPANFYFRAGKNALILALSVIPICIYFIDRYIHKNNFYNFFSLTVSLILLFFAHYPTFGIFIFLIIPWILSFIIDDLKARDYTKLFKLIFPFIICVIFSLIWFIPLYWIADNLINESVAAAPNIRVKTDLPFLLTSIKDTLNFFISNYFQKYHMYILIPIFLLTKKLRYQVIIIWTYLSLILLYILVTTTQTTRLLGMVPNTLEIIYPYIILLILLFSIIYSLHHFKLGKNPILLIGITLFFISLFSNYILRQQLVENDQRYSVVDDDDLKAFEFINTNIPEGTIILNYGNEDPNRKGLVFPVDGGLWIPLFTNNQNYIDFAEFSSKKTNDNYNLLKELRLSNDDTEIVARLKDEGNRYAYLDSGVFGESLHEDFFNKVPYEIIFSSGTVRILELK